MSSSSTKKPKKTNTAFRRFITWFKDTAWIQVLLIILLIFGLMALVPVAVSGIKSLIEASGESTFYKDHRTTYDEMLTKVNENSEVTIFFYSPTCSHCEQVQDKIEQYYTETENGKNRIVYTIDISDTDYITESQLQILHGEYERVYDTEDPSLKNDEYDEFKSASANSIPTPTIVLYINGEPSRISLGVDESNPIRYMEEVFYKDL